MREMILFKAIFTPLLPLSGPESADSGLAAVVELLDEIAVGCGEIVENLRGTDLQRIDIIRV